MTEPGTERALVLFSGGQDSTVCLAWALTRYGHVETVGFDYGQRHDAELEARQAVFEALARDFPEWAAGAARTTPSISGARCDQRDGADPRHRNQAERKRPAQYFRAGPQYAVLHLCGGDRLPARHHAACRRHVRDRLFRLSRLPQRDAGELGADLQLGTEAPFRIETPLMWRDKAETWAMAEALGGQTLVGLIAEHTHTCYRGVRDIRHDWGYGCGKCPACELRAAGYEKWRGGA